MNVQLNGNNYDYSTFTDEQKLTFDRISLAQGLIDVNTNAQIAMTGALLESLNSEESAEDVPTLEDI